REHMLARADAMTFLNESPTRYGLIYVDPPTFSNSKRAGDFDVQHDHVALLTMARSCSPTISGVSNWMLKPCRARSASRTRAGAAFHTTSRAGRRSTAAGY